jgi:hypothetical protein
MLSTEITKALSLDRSPTRGHLACVSNQFRALLKLRFWIPSHLYGHFTSIMSARRQEVLELVLKALNDKTPTVELEDEVIKDFDEYVKLDPFASLPLPFLVKVVTKGRLKISGDDVCKLFVNNVPYNSYQSIQLLGPVNFRNVSTPALLPMREVADADGNTIPLPFVAEIVAARAALEETKQCGGARVHDYNEAGVCKRCGGGKCLEGTGGLTKTHDFGDDGRCAVCGAPRCQFDSLHVFNYDGHCHICGKAQPTRCEIVGCQAIGHNPNCAICGKPIKKEG